jgi:hypothetical protein
LRRLCLGIGSEYGNKYTYNTKYPTIFDYDIVIINLPELIRSYYSYLAERKLEFEKFFESKGICFVVMNRYDKTTDFSNYDWCPFASQMKIVNKSGETMICQNKDARFIFESIKFEWNCFFSDYPENITVLAKNRASDPISVMVPYENGYCIFLPFTDKTTELLELLIEKGLNIIPEREKEIVTGELPSWATAFMTETELNLLETRNKIVEKLGKYNKFKPLLWETGDNLQELVIAAFEEMGIEVTRLPKESHGDFEFLINEGLIGVCEVKGLLGNADRRDLRQLLDYFIEQRDIEKRNVKGILIVNHYRNEKPSERGNPVTENALDLVQTYNFRVLTAVELYGCITKFWQNKLAKDAFLKMFQDV